MLIEYVAAAMEKAKYKLLPENEGYFGEVPSFQGVWANSSKHEACRHELLEVLESWMIVGIRLGLDLPVVAGINLNVKKRKQKVA